MWLRWYDETVNWISTQLEQERRRADKLAAKLRELGINPDEI
ncbi:hypothetical protein [uncultured Nostoc sp.]